MDHLEVAAKGRAALLAGELHREVPPAFEYWTRDMWYINVVHFAAAAELVRYEYTGTDMRAVTLHKQLL